MSESSQSEKDRLLQRQFFAIPLSSFQSAGAAVLTSFFIGNALPTNARVMSTEFVVTQAFAAAGLATGTGTIEANVDTAGTLCSPVSMLTTGAKTLAGTNPAPSRAGQQIQATFTITGSTFNLLTGGAVTVNIYFSVML